MLSAQARALTSLVFAFGLQFGALSAMAQDPVDEVQTDQSADQLTVEADLGADFDTLVPGQSPAGSSGGARLSAKDQGTLNAIAEMCASGRPLPFVECPQAADEAPVVDVGAVASRAVLSLQVPPPGLVIGPDPAGNKWNMLPIGLPVWAGDASGLQPISTVVTQEGITIRMTARPSAVSVDWGDGTVIECRSMTVRRQGLEPFVESPDCGHTYQVPDIYTISATVPWEVTWEALGQSGVVVLESRAAVELDVGEIVTVLVPER